MTEPNDAAFPIVGELKPQASGLGKREYFAAIALGGLLANSHPDLSSCTASECASMAVDLADALIEKLNEEHNA